MHKSNSLDKINNYSNIILIRNPTSPMSSNRFSTNFWLILHQFCTDLKPQWSVASNSMSCSEKKCVEIEDDVNIEAMKKIELWMRSWRRRRYSSVSFFRKKT